MSNRGSDLPIWAAELPGSPVRARVPPRPPPKPAALRRTQRFHHEQTTQGALSQSDPTLPSTQIDAPTVQVLIPDPSTVTYSPSHADQRGHVFGQGQATARLDPFRPGNSGIGYVRNQTPVLASHSEAVRAEALRLQQEELARIAQRATMDSRFQARTADQLRRDLEVAVKISIEDAAAQKESQRTSGSLPPMTWPTYVSKNAMSNDSVKPRERSFETPFEMSNATNPSQSMSRSHFDFATPPENATDQRGYLGPFNDNGHDTVYPKLGQSTYHTSKWESLSEIPPFLPKRPPTFATMSSDAYPEADLQDTRFPAENGIFTEATSTEAAAVCEACNTEQSLVSYCPACTFHFCRKHWDEQLTHRHSRRASGVPHEKTNPAIAQKVKSIIEPSLTEEENEGLHREDDDTTWFGVLPNANDQLLFHDFGRFEEFLSQSEYTPKSAQFPSLISFVGSTGAGKSTIVKGLVKMAKSNHEHFIQQTPVVGLVQHQSVPTSGEVHLYWDTTSLTSPRPLLYADCEGFGGGSREPIAARATATVAKSKKSPFQGKRETRDLSTAFAMDSERPDTSPYRSTTHVAEGRHRSHGDVPNSYGLPYRPRSTSNQFEDAGGGWIPGSEKSYRGITREIMWAKEKHQRNRQYIVENLYPRILYSFSDIVVLGMRNPKQIEHEIERLMQWAANAIEKSSNQPMLPYAIIVINATDHRTEERLLDPITATHVFLSELDGIVDQNPKFHEWATYWRERQKMIETTRDLLLAFYTDVKIILVPDKRQPRLVWQQYEKLHLEIIRAAEMSQKRRLNVRLLLSAEKFNAYLQLAFQHFSQTLERPFDFVRASANFNQLEPQFNHVLCLIRDYRAHWPDQDLMEVFVQVIPLVSSAILLEVARADRRGTPKDLFPEYHERIAHAITVFFDEEWPCEARHPKTRERCIIVKTRHETKGHQLAGGKIWNGKYETQRDVDMEPIFSSEVYRGFVTLYNLMMGLGRVEGPGAAEPTLAYQIHQRHIIRRQCSFLRSTPHLVSHRICLCCLFREPSHPLLCGHVICDLCFHAAGERAREHVTRLAECPICGAVWSQGRVNVEILTKPETCGLRVLTLDGGGVRAIIELVILGLIEERIGLGIAVQEFFDLIVGTSGGGIVALAIGEKNMTVAEATEAFRLFAQAAFVKRKGSEIPLLGRLVTLTHQSKYESTGLETSLKTTFGDDLLFGGKRSLQSPSRCKVAVTATDTNKEARLLSNYNRPVRIDTPYNFQRFESPKQELRTWEAARATSAAPGFFRSYYSPANGHTYQDGALKLNNPILAADLERQVLWPDCAQSPPDVLLSIGTGLFPQANSRGGGPGPRIGIGISEGVRTLVNVGTDAVNSDLDCEKTWQEFMQCSVPDGSPIRERYHRLNVDFSGPKIDLDAVGNMRELEQQTRNYYSKNSRLIDKVAAQLLASLFYFEMGSRVARTISGVIKCRLPEEATRGSSLKKLVAGLQNMQYRARQFRVFPILQQGAHWKSEIISDSMLASVSKSECTFAIDVTLDVSEGVQSGIYLDIPGFETQIISGFSRVLLGHVSESTTPVMAPRTLYNSALDSEILIVPISPSQVRPESGPEDIGQAWNSTLWPPKSPQTSIDDSYLWNKRPWMKKPY